MNVRFGDFEIDGSTRELRRLGTPVALQPRVFDLLVYLAKERHRVVPREELIDVVWGCVVTPGVLTTALRLLRIAVDDDARSPRVVRTLHRRGYRFVAEVLDEPIEAPTCVGRGRELALLDAFVAGEGAAFALTGMPGVGKSTLLHAWAHARRRGGGDVVALSAGLLSSDPSTCGDRIFERAPGVQGGVLLIDDYEELLGIDEWLRREVLPKIAPRKLIVACEGRGPGGWARESATRFTTLEVSGLSLDDAQRLLRTQGIPEGESLHWARKVHGHPLSLQLVTQLSAEHRRACADDPALALPTLAAVFAESAPSERHRMGLDVAALIRELDIDTLEATLGEPCTQLFEWLEAQPFITASSGTLRMHAAAAGALLDRMDGRPRLQRYVENAVRHLVGAMEGAKTPSDQARFSGLLMSTMRLHPAMREFYDPRADELSLTLTRDVESFLALVGEMENADSLRIHEEWLREDDAWELWVVRDGDTTLGGTLVLNVDANTAADFDPAVALAVRTLGERQGEGRALVHRTLIARPGELQRPTIQRCHDVLNVNHHLRMGGEHQASFVIYAKPHPFAALAHSVDFEPLGDALVGNTAHELFFRGFSEGGRAWLERVLATSVQQALQFAPTGTP